MEQERKLSEAELREEQRNKKKRRAAAGAVALMASGGLVLGGLFNSPAALLEETDLTPPPVVSEDDGGDELEGAGGAGEEESSRIEDAVQQEERELAPEKPEGVRAWILRLPYAVRLLVLLPLWALGWLLQTGAAALWSALLSPVLGKALSWLLLLGALLLALLLAGKTVFPDLPVKKILNKRNVLGLVIGSVALGVLDLLLPLFWTEYSRFEAIARAVGIGGVFCAVALSFFLRERRRRRAQLEKQADEAKPEAEKETPRPLTQREILAMAESVSRPR